MSVGGDPVGDKGRTVGGRYRLLERIGSGGMGTVWRARDELMEREVAVKQPRLPGDPEDESHRKAAHRLYREARAAARVDHPSAVSIHDVVVEEDGAGPDGLPWIVMELVRGESLHEVLRRGPLEPAEAARIGLAVLGALRAAHAVGIVHRDVKPANVLLGPRDRVVLTDFGIAHIQGEESLTATGEFVGSLEFIAPERMSGRGAGPASDLWSLGVLLYAAVEGWSPFRRTTLESTLAAILSADLPEPKQAGPLGPLLRRLLVRDPDRRPGPAEVAVALEAVTTGHPTPTPRDGHTDLDGAPDRTGCADPDGERQARGHGHGRGHGHEDRDGHRDPEGDPDGDRGGHRRENGDRDGHGTGNGDRDGADLRDVVRAREAAVVAVVVEEGAEPQDTGRLREFGEDVGTVRLSAEPAADAVSRSGPPAGTRSRARRPLLRRPAPLTLLAAVLAGGAWLGTSFLWGADSGAVTDRTAPHGSAPPAHSPSPSPSSPSWTVHHEKDLDAVLTLPAEYKEAAREGSAEDQPRLVVYDTGLVQVRLTRWDRAPGVPMAQAQRSFETWNSYHHDARNETTRTTFQGYDAALSDTTYDMDESPTRVMELFVLTGDGRMYALRVDMPKGTPSEKQGTAVFKAARDRLRIETP
jgi:hypothetical protein